MVVGFITTDAISAYHQAMKKQKKKKSHMAQ
jgi:hypothetical protein